MTESEVRAAVQKCGSIDAAAADLGMSRASFRAIAKEYGITAQETLPEADEVLAQENRKLKRQIKKLAEGEHDAERVVRRLEEAIERQKPVWGASKVWEPSGKQRSPQEMALLYSDLHASEVVSLEGTRGINEYDWTIMRTRMDEIQRSVLSHKEHFGFEVDVLHLWMLGDMLSGDIHDELAITNDRPTVDAVVDLAYDHVPWLLAFADAAPWTIKLSCVPGNHPRFAQKPSAKQYHNNADWLFYKMLEAILRGHPQFEFSIPRASMNVTMICRRWRVLHMHGDGIRTTMPGVPWGGVHRRVTTLEAQFAKSRQPLDFVAFGHWHTMNALDGIQARTLMNGSVKGADEYSLQRFGSGRDASQLLTTFHPKRGLTGMYPLDLQGALPASEGWEKAA